MATATPTAPRRHALGLPAGSVRAMLAIGVLGYLWLLITLLGRIELPEVPESLKRRNEASLSFMYMNMLMLMILSSFFSAHGHNIGAEPGRRSPLGLPRGSIRILLLAGYLALAVWSYQQRAAFQLPDNANLLLVVAILVLSFAVGFVITGAVRFVSRGNLLPAWFQDIQAWFALLGLVLMGAVLMIRLVINSSVPLENQVGVETIEAILTGLIGFYYGSRS